MEILGKLFGNGNHRYFEVSQSDERQYRDMDGDSLDLASIPGQIDVQVEACELPPGKAYHSSSSQPRLVAIDAT